MSSCAINKSKHRRSSPSSDSSLSIAESNISDLSPMDLDDMFTTNLQLLRNLDINKPSSNSNDMYKKTYQSSLNVYIGSQKREKPIPAVACTYIQIIPISDTRSRNNTKSIKLHRSNIYSSYETLYDDLYDKPKDEQKQHDWECMSQSMIESSKFGSIMSIDSDKTLKSRSSTDSSVVSLKHCNNEDVKKLGSNLASANSRFDMLPKVRCHQNDTSPRPVSYHMGDSINGHYLSRPPFHSFNNSIDTKKIPKQMTSCLTSTVTNRSRNSPSFSMSSDLRNNNSLYDNKDVLRIVNRPHKIVVSSHNMSFKDNSLKKQINSPPFHSCLHLNTNNMPISTPIVPARNTMKTVTKQLSNNVDIIQTLSISRDQCKNRSTNNVYRDSRQRPIQSNGTNNHQKSQNHDNGYSYSDGRMNGIAYYQFSQKHS